MLSIRRWAGTAGTVIGASVTEEDLIRNADYMAEHLKPYGWEYVVCDIQWSEPTADSTAYHAFAELCMDEYGRLMPLPKSFSLRRRRKRLQTDC